MLQRRRLWRAVSAVVLACAGLGGVTPSSAGAADERPANDDRGAAIDIDPVSVPTSLAMSTAGATVEPGEPSPCGAMGATVWFRYRASAGSSSDHVTVSTRGSDFDTAIAVYYAPPGSPPPSFAYRCSDDGYLANTSVTFTAFPSQDFWVQVGGAAGATGNLRLSLTKGGGVRFDLRYPDGTPAPSSGACPEVSNQLDQEPGGYSYGTPFADQRPGASRFQVTGLPSGATRILMRSCGATAPAFAPTWSPWLDVTEGQTTDVAPVVVSRPASLKVVVRDAVTGDPMPGTYVGASPLSPTAPDRFGSNGVTGADGTFLLRGLAGGEYRVYASAPSQPTLSRVVSVTPATESAPVETATTFDVSPLGAIEGVVLTEDGAPAIGACVIAFSDASPTFQRGALTSETGYYRTAVDAGPGNVRFGVPQACGSGANVSYGASAAAGFTVRSLEATRVDGVVPGAGVLSGVVRDTSTGQAVTSGCIEAFGGVDNLQTRLFFSSSTGFYRLPGLGAGSYKVHLFGNCFTNSGLRPVWSGGGTDEASATAFPVAAGEETEHVDLNTSPVTGGVGLRVVDADTGKFVAGFGRINDGSPLGGPGLFPDASGQAFAPVAPGTYGVTFWPHTSINGVPAYPTTGQSVTVGEDIVEVRIELAAFDDDGDGLRRRVDNCPFVANPDQADADADDLGDACDGHDDRFLDGDADGVDDRVDNCAGVANADQADTDHDGVGDACDSDDDADTVADADDNCPLVVNAMQTDSDGDGVGDACDADDDADGVPDSVDNCTTTPNAGQADLDGDGVGDACDPDDDGDGVPDSVDNCPSASNGAQSDLDGDGVGDACDPDDDGDGHADAVDNCPSTSNADQRDLDGDGLGDACDPDDDGDGAPNVSDNCARLPNPSQTDLDGDGIGDACDPDDDGDAVPDPTDNCPVTANATQADRDRDGVGDACDPRFGRSTKPPKVK